MYIWEPFSIMHIATYCVSWHHVTWKVGVHVEEVHQEGGAAGLRVWLTHAKKMYVEH